MRTSDAESAPSPHAAEIFRSFAPEVQRQRLQIAAGGAFGLIYALTRVAEPWPLKVVFDQVLFHKRAHGAWFGLFTIFGRSAYEILAASALLLIAAGLVRGFSYYYEDYLLSSAAQQIVYRIRARLYRHLHRLPVTFHQRRRTGETLVRLTSDIVVLRDMLVDSIVNIGTGVVMVALMLAVMFVVDPVLTALSIAAMPCVALLSALYGRRIRTNSRKQRKREGQVAALMQEALAAAAVVQLHGAEEREQERFEAANRRSLKQGLRATRFEARMNRGVELALAAATVVVLWVGTLRALHGAITPGELVVFISYLRAAQRPLRRASKTVQRSAKALAAAERIVEMLGMEPELTDAPDAVAAPPFDGRIAFNEVHFAYEPSRPILRGINFVVEPCSTVAIVGPTGSGKSTLLNLVPRLVDPVEGRVLADGHDLRSLTLQSVREQVSLVQQETVLFGLSIAENIRYGCPDATDDEIRRAAEAAGLSELVSELPAGFDTVLHERGASLSGGQRQRIAIARALVRRTPILLLDEPTTGLDPFARQAVTESLEQLIDETTTLVATHDLELARRADDIVVIDDGRIVARGAYDDLSEHSPAFRRLAGLSPSATRRTPALTSGSGTRVLFYSHNGVGVGHLQRQLDLAMAYRERHPDSVVLLASGSHAASIFRIPTGIDYVKLPSLRKVDGRTWTPRELPLPLKDVIELRTELLQKTVRKVSPDLLVADFMPGGPYGELLPALDELRRCGGRAVMGFRDVLDDPPYVRQLWEEAGVYDVLRTYYSAICVYGDPLMLDFVAAYGFDDELAGRLHYCGYLGRRPAGKEGAVRESERPIVIATSGGGADGPKMLETFVGAAARLRPRLGGTWTAVTGPLMADEDHARVASLAEHDGVAVQHVVPELRNSLAHADCVVSMAGYNTVCDIMSYGRRSVLVPRVGPSKEQSLRAERLREWGVAEVVGPDQLHEDGLAAAIANALERPSFAAPVPLAGLERAVDVFDGVGAAKEVASPNETCKDSPMPLRPSDLRNADLPREFRGYSIEATRQLLEDAADELKAALAKQVRLAEEMQRFEEQLAASAAPHGEAGEKERLIGAALVAATRTAEELREQGRREAEKAIAEADARARDILAGLEGERERIKSEAEKEVRSLLDEAKAEAGRLLAEGERERNELEAEAARLRTLTDQMSANLRSLLAGMLEQLEERVNVGASGAEEAVVPLATEPEHGAAPGELLEQLRPAPGERQERARP
jgi:ATP-binding cassette subfamily B protein